MSTPPLQEILMQEALKYENGYLEVPNLGLLNHYLNHPQRNSIVDLSLYCYQHIVEAIEMFAKDMNNLSVAKLYLRAVGIDDDTFQTLISKDSFSKLKKLGLSYNSELTDQTISNIASEENPLQLRVLELDTTGVTDEGVKTLAFSSSFSKLKELDLSGLSITTAAIQYLAHPFAIPRLSLLQIHLTEIDQAVFPLFSLSSSFAKLKSLCISHVGIMDPQEIAVLCNRSPYSFSLKKLTLKSCELGIGHMKLICQSENFKYLESLDISENDLTDKAVSLLLRAKFQNTLKNLNLARNTISDKFLKKLGKSKCYQNLETLNLVSCHKIKSLEALTYRKKRPFQGLYLSKLKSSQKEMTAILHNHFWKLKKLKMNTISGVPDWSSVFKGLVGPSNLQALKINGLVIGNKALSMLFTQVQFPFLGILKLSGKSNFDEETMKIICFSQKLPKLNSLILKHDLISDAEIECITKTENLPLLKVLNLYGNYNLTVDCLKKIMKSDNLPFLEVIIYDQGEMLNRY